MKLEEYLDTMHAKKIEEYSSMMITESSYVSIMSYKNIVSGRTITASADILADKKSDSILVNYKLDERERFKSLVKKDEYFGRDYYEILNISDKNMPDIRSNNGDEFTVSLNIDSKTVRLGVDRNSAAVIKNGRVEIYTMVGGNVNWDNIKEIYQIYEDGYGYIDLAGKTRQYQRLYLDGSSIGAFQFRIPKSLTGDLYLDINPKKIKWISKKSLKIKDKIEEYEEVTEFRLTYDKYGIVNGVYKYDFGEEKEVCLYSKDNKITYSFHPVVFDPFKLNNFEINNNHIWVLETRKLDFGYQIYDREVFWIDDYEHLINNIGDLDI